MKTRIISRTISVLLTVALLCGVCMLSAFAQDSQCDCGVCPTIVLPGISHSELYLIDEAMDDNIAIDPISGEQIKGGVLIYELEPVVKKLLKDTLMPLLKTLVLQKNADNLDAELTALFDTAFSLVSMDNNGELVNKDRIDVEKFNRDGAVSFAQFPQETLDWLYSKIPLQNVTARVGLDHMYFFTFSLYSDAITSAHELENFIEQVKKDSGHDKVNLLNVSLGGTVFTAYANLETVKAENYKNINKVINAVSVLDGTQIVADLYATRLDPKSHMLLSDEFFYSEFFPYLFGTMENYTPNGEMTGYAVNILLRMLPRETISSFLKAFYDSFYRNILQNSPQIWSMVPSELYPELSEKLLSDPALSAVKAKTDAFYQAQLALADNINAMRALEEPIDINNICGYNHYFGDVSYGFFSIVASANKNNIPGVTVNSDGVLDIASTSLGATSVCPNEQFPEGYVQAHNSSTHPDYSYISPDRSIDASTCLLPDNTWFFRNMNHGDSGNDADVMDLVLAFIVDDELEDVHSKPDKYSQFSEFVTDKPRLSDLNPLQERIVNVMRTITKANSDLLMKIVGGRGFSDFVFGRTF